MTKFFLAAGVAALAIAAPVAAERGGKGGGGKGQAAKVERGGGKSASAKVERRGGGQRVALMDRGKGREIKADRHVKVEVRGADRRVVKFERKDRDFKVANKIDRRDVVRVRDFDDDWEHPGKGHWAGSCPPGLSKNVGYCMPPGQYKKHVLGRLIPTAYRNGLVPLALRDLYRDDDDYYYRYGDGYMYRVDRRTNLVAALLPLLGGGLTTGQLFPQTYMNSYVPSYYQSFYPDTSDNYYRYANGNVYAIDPYTGMIEGVIPMYASGYGYGQMLPPTYSAYNVPYQYRDLYYDTADSYYRYAPGAIYQVDPRTSLITAVASLLTGNGLSVGQPLPMGYSAYNVPLAYRDEYYDTPDAWYRYNNGYIYQVDPTTQLVTSIIRAIV
jgi:hypothetical protein